MDSLPSAERLNHLLDSGGLVILQKPQSKQLIDYLSLILRWNARTNLTSVRDPEAILTRHIVESIDCAQALPLGIATLLDYGSGAGFPGIPISICRPEIAVTLAESQGKKAAFLQEATRVTGITAKVHSARAETLTTQFDCVTLRAVDHMASALQSAASLVNPGGWLALLTTVADFPPLQSALTSIPIAASPRAEKTASNTASPHFVWSTTIPLRGSEQRILALARRS